MPNQLGSLGAGGGAAGPTLLNNLAFYYKLDEATTVPRVDSVGGASLTETGTVNSGTGKISNGAVFANDNNNRLSRTVDAAIVQGDRNRTYRAWVKFSALSQQMIFSQMSATSYGYYLGVASANLTWQVGNGLTTAIGTATVAMAGLAIDTWYHIVTYHDTDNNRVGLQIDNGAITWANTTGTAGDATSNFRIGSWEVSAAYPGKGTYDEICAWDRLLSADEVTEDYNGGDGVTYPFDAASAGVGYSRVSPTMASGQTARILVPTTYDAGTPTTLILYHHGSGEDETDLENADKFDVIFAAIQQGWIVAAVKAYDNNWGNQNSIDGYNEVYAYLDANYNLNRVVFLSQSMGGLSGLLCVADGTIPVDGWYGIYPVCNLADVFDGNAGTYAAAIRSAYGIAADGSDYAAKTAGHDPVLLAAAEFTGLPMRFVASAADTVVDKTANSDAMATLVTGQATEYVVVVASGDHGDASHFQPSDFIAFVGRC